MRKVTREITCDRCGVEVKEDDEWGLTIDHYDPDDVGYIHFKAELCPECKEIALVAVGAAGITIRYSEE